VIVRFDGIRVDNIYDYTFALRSRKPGQDVRITVKRAARSWTWTRPWEETMKFSQIVVGR